MVLVGWAIGKPFLLDFEPFAVLVLLLAVVHTYFCSSDGNSNWCGPHLRVRRALFKCTFTHVIQFKVYVV
jgi:Ca2+/H+ antiporter